MIHAMKSLIAFIALGGWRQGLLYAGECFFHRAVSAVIVSQSLTYINKCDIDRRII